MATVIPSARTLAEADSSESSQTASAIPATESESISEEIVKMVSEREKEEDQHRQSGGTNVDDISPEERKRQEEMPRNPKKRMWEENIDKASKKDEL
ncbi:hypothetical protein DIZ76_014832 [Coccidioides immitis]|nr:hypothetical protein DIZ76_014832 [Coccidioides immitis]